MVLKARGARLTTIFLLFFLFSVPYGISWLWPRPRPSLNQDLGQGLCSAKALALVIISLGHAAEYPVLQATSWSSVDLTWFLAKAATRPLGRASWDAEKTGGPSISLREPLPATIYQLLAKGQALAKKRRKTSARRLLLNTWPQASHQVF